MSSSGIYSIWNLVSEKMYIGSALSFRRRWALHKSELRGGVHHNKHLQQSWDKYGSEAFEFHILEFVDSPENLLLREQVWLDFFKPQYNICRVAGNTIGVIRSPETRRRMSESNKKRPPFTAERREKIADAARGRTLSPENKEKLHGGNRGRPLSPQHREKISAANSKRVWSEESKARASSAKKGIKRGPFTAEHKAKLSASGLKRFREQKEEAK